MADLQTILEMVDTLSDADKERLRHYLDTEDKVSPVPKQKKRILDLHPGAITITDDFNDELPDEFWFDEDELST